MCTERDADGLLVCLLFCYLLSSVFSVSALLSMVLINILYLHWPLTLTHSHWLVECPKHTALLVATYSLR